MNAPFANQTAEGSPRGGPSVRGAPSSPPGGGSGARGWITLLIGLCSGLLLGGGFFWWSSAESPPVPDVVVVVEPAAEEADPGPKEVPLPLDRIDRLLPLGGAGICATARGELVCSGDMGESWSSFGALGEPILAVVGDVGKGLEPRGGLAGAADSAAPGHAGTESSQELRAGEPTGPSKAPRSVLAASADGGLYRMEPGSHPTLVTRPEAALHVVDASARGGRLLLLAHRYDQPDDELRLPRVVETLLLEAAEGGGALRELGRWRGFGGERLLLEEASIVTWTLSDRRAWRSSNGGASVQRLSVNEKFGADYGGLRAVVERRSERLPGPGRPARAISSLWIAKPGQEWENVLEREGPLLVDFADPELGVVVATDGATAWITRDGGRSFEPWISDDRLSGAVTLSHVAGRFVVALTGGSVFLLDPEWDPSAQAERTDR